MTGSDGSGSRAGVLSWSDAVLRRFRESMQELTRAVPTAPAGNPPHVHVDEFIPTERWTNRGILALLRVVRATRVKGACPVLVIACVQLPSHAALPDDWKAIADLWRAAQDDPPAIYLLDRKSCVPPSHALLLPRPTKQLTERAGPYAAYLIPWFREGDGYAWEINLVPGKPRRPNQSFLT